MITLQFVPYSSIEKLSSAQRIKKLLNIVRDDRIVLLEGRLGKEEEAELIRETMANINGKFKGIELSTMTPEGEQKSFLKKIHSNIVELLSGTRQGITIIGPATVIKEIKKDPEKVQLLTVESRKTGLMRNGKRKRTI